MNLVVSHWSANVAVLAAGLAVVVVHLAGLLGLRGDARRGGAALPAAWPARPSPSTPGCSSRSWRWSRRWATGPGRFIWIRVLQDIVLGVYAPPLIVLGAPWLVLWRGLGRTGRPRGHGGGPRAARAPAAQLAGRGDRPVRRGVVRLVRSRAVRRGGAPPGGARGPGGHDHGRGRAALAAAHRLPASSPAVRAAVPGVCCWQLSCCAAPSWAWCSASGPPSFTPPTSG